MAKSKSSIDKSKLTLGMAKPVIKKESEAQVPAAQIEEAVKQIHNPEPAPKVETPAATTTPPITSTPTVGATPPVAKQEKPKPAAKPKEEAPKYTPQEYLSAREAKKQGRPTSKVSDVDYIRISIDLPKPLFKSIKKKLVDMEMTMMDYVTMLIEKEESGEN